MEDDKLLQAVQQILRTADLEGLIRMGAPDDEYDSEARLIHDQLCALPYTIEQVCSMVEGLFQERFDRRASYPKAEIESIASQLIAAVSHNKLVS